MSTNLLNSLEITRALQLMGFPAKNFLEQATRILSADVALWSAKVTTHNAKADPSKIQVAKTSPECTQ